MNFIVYDKTGRILSIGHCQKNVLHKQAGKNQFAMEGAANDITQKVVKGKIVDKTLAEIERDNPKTPVKPFREQRAKITNEQLQAILDRLTVLEAPQT